MTKVYRPPVPRLDRNRARIETGTVRAVTDWEELTRLGLYDPHSPDAADRRELLEYLDAQGVTSAQMLEADEEGRLTFVASDIAIRPGAATLTLAATAERVGLEPATVVRLWRAAGFPPPGPDGPVLSDQDAEALHVLAIAVAVLGEDATVQVVRVFGTGLARMADAVFRAILKNVDNAYGPMSESPLEAARSSTMVNTMAEGSGLLLDVLFRRHVLGVSRASAHMTGTGPEASDLAIGFVDLVGSTGLVVDLSPTDLAAAMSEFDALSSEIAADHGGRVVKLIGDAVMFVTAVTADALAIALDLVAALAEHRVLPGARAAVANGLVTMRDGDYFGPVVNRAARLAQVAEPGSVVTDRAVADDLDPARFTTVDSGTHVLRGFVDPVEVRTVRRTPRSA